jgi:hypothetical protein
MPAAWQSRAEKALNIASSEFPYAVSCTPSARKRLPQPSGRMKRCIIIFYLGLVGVASVSGSYFMLMETDDIVGQRLLTPVMEMEES